MIGCAMLVTQGAWAQHVERSMRSLPLLIRIFALKRVQLMLKQLHLYYVASPVGFKCAAAPFTCSRHIYVTATAAMTMSCTAQISPPDSTCMAACAVTLIFQDIG